ncbi:MAG: type VI secretion system baseplate subunit TssK [Candidatus Angelobacter sp. Gp1-AA117]|nr:MAG: type VI secretion system baseplate subunit TssK [Candidatus Angelobacter sp. Gp1-AA117]
MRHLQPVYWAKGTFLAPQHLQIQDRYIENLLHFQMDAVTEYLWGFAKLEIDREKLRNGEFCVVEARGILPDGLLFDIPEADDPVPSRTIKEAFSEGRDSVAIYLSVPAHRENGMNIGAEAGTTTRFVTTIRTVPDENSGSSTKPVQMARKNFKLLVGEENQAGSTILKVAEVQRDSAGVYSLISGFVPPLIDVHGNNVLRGIARSLLEMLSAKSSLLAATRRQKNQSLAEFTASDIARFWLLYTVNYHLPLFRHLFHRRVVHPEQLFSAMLSLAGTLTTFSSTVSPRDLPEYKHDDLGKCFLELERKIKFLLETVVPANYVAIPLKLARPSVYSATIEDERLLHNCKFFLAISADIGDAELVARVPSLVKAGAASHVEEMIRRALPGLRLTYSASPPPDIPVKLKYKYFSLELTGKVWEGVQRARDFGVYAPAEMPNPQLELIVVLPADLKHS